MTVVFFVPGSLPTLAVTVAVWSTNQLLESKVMAPETVAGESSSTAGVTVTSPNGSVRSLTE